MLDFIIVLSIGILGLLAQAAGGKRVKRLVSAPRPVIEPASAPGAVVQPPAVVAATETQTGHSETSAAPLSSAQIEDEQPSEIDVKSAIGSSAESTADENSSTSAPQGVGPGTDEPGPDSTKPATESAVVPAEQSTVPESEVVVAEQSTVAESEVVVAEQSTVTESEPVAAGQSAVTEPEPVAADQSTVTEPEPVAAAQSTVAEPETVAADQSTVAEPETVAADQSAAVTAIDANSEPATETASDAVVAVAGQAAATGSETAGVATATEPAALAAAAHVADTPPEVRPTSNSEPSSIQPEAVPASAAAQSVSPPVMREEFYLTRKPGIEWFLRITIFLWFIGLALYYWMTSNGLTSETLGTPDPWVMQVTFVCCALTGLNLVKGFRTLFSYIFTAVDCVFDIKLVRATVKSWAAFKPAFEADRVFMPASIPHMVGFFIYVQTMFYLLASMAPKSDFQMPGLPIPMPLPLDQLFSYNGLGLVMLSFCGCGIFVTRSFKEVLNRLALVRPTPQQIMIGLGLVFMSFMYDFLWAFYTHGQHLGLDSKLAGYNGGTFTASGGFTGALILALATAIFAGVGEETLIRGALQPVLGLVPAAILHGVLHAQFQHAPIFIIQVAGWSILMGIVKRYTNTSTTIIGHAGFNFVTTFLFAYNPPDIL
ncbi:MAG: CPBP family intramembrane metalloprotease [Cyanobacteria bacterium SZAS LIN-5]|nr:CPBP family intramembrane metalloprotease [Cyanobacteria bacterium SZAS LIN-5]